MFLIVFVSACFEAFKNILLQWFKVLSIMNARFLTVFFQHASKLKHIIAVVQSFINDECAVSYCVFSACFKA